MLFNIRELDEVNERISDLLKRSKFRKLIDGPDDTCKVMELFCQIKNSIDALIVSIRS
jgi:hypothetical protein